MAATDLHPKVSLSAFAGAIVTVLIVEANRRGLPITGEEGSAIQMIIMGAIGYAVPGSSNDNIPVTIPAGTLTGTLPKAAAPIQPGTYKLVEPLPKKRVGRPPKESKNAA